MILEVTGCPGCGEMILSWGQEALCEEDHWGGNRALGRELGDQAGASAVWGAAPLSLCWILHL